jgi:hypothetical protein
MSGRRLFGIARWEKDISKVSAEDRCFFALEAFLYLDEDHLSVLVDIGQMSRVLRSW